MSGGSSDQEEKNVEVADEKSEARSVSIEYSPKKDKEAHASSKKDDDSDEKDDESEDSEEGVGLLDRPVEVSGSRERKKVERLDVSYKKPSTKEKKKIPEGSGKKFGDCPRIEHQISKCPARELKILHRILFNRPGSFREIKKNIRLFNGFPFKKDSDEYEKKKKNLEKIVLPELRHICDILDIERTGSREEAVCRIMEFLVEPKPSGKEVQPPKRKKGLKKKNEEKGSKKERLASEKSKSASSEGSAASEDEVKAEKDNKEKEVAVSSDSDLSEVEQKKPEAAKKKKKQVKQKNEKPKKNGTKSASKRSKKKIDTESSDEASSDDAPLVKKAKSPPTNDEIKVLVKKILDASDLQEITMKTVIKQVFDEFPDFDISDKKEFIKATVKSVIS